MERKPEEIQCLELIGNNKVFRGGTLSLVLTSSLPALLILISKSVSICTNCSTQALSNQFLFLPWPPVTTLGIWKNLLFKNEQVFHVLLDILKETPCKHINWTCHRVCVCKQWTTLWAVWISWYSLAFSPGHRNTIFTSQGYTAKELQV